MPTASLSVCCRPEDTNSKCTYYSAAAYRMLNVCMGILVAASKLL